MKKKIDPIEQEVNEIRLRKYEETKHMTTAELCEYINKKTEATIKKYGMKVVTKEDLVRPVSE
jgi:hypothetical protein